MHPEIIQDNPGNCPVCGMNLIPVNDKEDANKTNHDHDKHAAMGHAGHDHIAMIADFKKRFYVVLATYYSYHAFITNDTAVYWC